MTLDNGNGRKIAVHEVEIAKLTEAIKAQTELLNAMFGPDGVCFKKHARIDDSTHDIEKKIISNQNQTKWQWFAMTGLGASIVYIYKLIIDVLRG